MLSRRSGTILAILVGSLCWAAAGRAAPPCLADIQKLCAGVPAVEGKIQGCLKAHEADLSKECKSHLDGLKQTAGLLVAVCRYDIARFCTDVQPGGGRIATCLQKNQDELSPECKDRFKKQPALH